MVELIPLWRSLIDHAAEEFADWFEWTINLESWLGFMRLNEWWPDYEKMPPTTLVHNDFNPRNIGFRRDDGQLSSVPMIGSLRRFRFPSVTLLSFFRFMELERTPTKMTSSIC